MGVFIAILLCCVVYPILSMVLWCRGFVGIYHYTQRLRGDTTPWQRRQINLGEEAEWDFARRHAIRRNTRCVRACVRTAFLPPGTLDIKKMEAEFSSYLQTESVGEKKYTIKPSIRFEVTRRFRALNAPSFREAASWPWSKPILGFEFLRGYFGCRHEYGVRHGPPDLMNLRRLANRQRG